MWGILCFIFASCEPLKRPKPGVTAKIKIFLKKNLADMPDECIGSSIRSPFAYFPGRYWRIIKRPRREIKLKASNHPMRTRQKASVSYHLKRLNRTRQQEKEIITYVIVIVSLCRIKLWVEKILIIYFIFDTRRSIVHLEVFKVWVEN